MGFKKQLLLSVSVVLLGVYLFYIRKAGLHQTFSCAMFGKCPPILIDGNVAPGFEIVKQNFEKNYQDGEEISSCFVAYHKNEKVVDLCGGYADSGLTYRHALTNLFSATKVVYAIAIAILVDRGFLDYHEKVATYWPEFAQGKKENITFSDLLTHAGGVAWLDDPINFEQVADHDLVAKRVAEQQHNYNAGKVHAYHGLTYLFPLNELVRRRDPQKRTMGQFIRDEINKVLGVEVYVGLEDEEVEKLTKRYSSSIDGSLPRYLLQQVLRGDFEFLSSLKADFTALRKAMSSVKLPPVSARNTIEYYKTPIVGISNAESLAKIAAVMAQHGSFEGKQLISLQTYQKAMQPLPEHEDAISKLKLVRTVGGFAQFYHYDKKATYGWFGLGGHLIHWDPEAEIGFGYVMNAGSPQMIGGKGAKLLAITQQIIHEKNNKN